MILFQVSVTFTVNMAEGGTNTPTAPTRKHLRNLSDAENIETSKKVKALTVEEKIMLGNYGDRINSNPDLFAEDYDNQINSNPNSDIEP